VTHNGNSDCPILEVDRDSEIDLENPIGLHGQVICLWAYLLRVRACE
jgi:hypothetical protein